MSEEQQKIKECIEQKVDVGILKQQVSTLTALSDKLHNIVDKLVEHHSASISKIYERMENRRLEDNDDKKEIHERIDDAITSIREAEIRLMSELRSFREDFKEHTLDDSDNLNMVKDEISKTKSFNYQEHKQLDKWKWMVTGGIIVLSWLLLKIEPDTIIKLLAR